LLRLAGVLGVDPTMVQLRSGVVPAQLSARIAADPEGFLSWAGNS
jgi:hypothetical protein